LTTREPMNLNGLPADLEHFIGGVGCNSSVPRSNESVGGRSM
jgi:hypothetical protein